MRNASYLEYIVHALIFGVAIGLSWHYWQNHSGRADVRDQNVDIAAAPELASWRTQQHRVFFFVSPTCVYCNRSMEFYARLSHTVDSLKQAGAPAAIAAVVGPSTSRRAQWNVLRRANVHVDTMLSARHRAARVDAVPTVILTGPDAAVDLVRVGLQEDDGMSAILSVIRSWPNDP